MVKTAKKAIIESSLEADLQDIIDAVEDELLVVDPKYRVRFANAAVLRKYKNGHVSPIGNY